MRRSVALLDVADVLRRTDGPSRRHGRHRPHRVGPAHCRDRLGGGGRGALRPGRRVPRPRRGGGGGAAGRLDARRRRRRGEGDSRPHEPGRRTAARTARALDDPAWTTIAACSEAVLAALEALRHLAVPRDERSREEVLDEHPASPPGVGSSFIPTPWGPIALGAEHRSPYESAWAAARDAGRPRPGVGGATSGARETRAPSAPTRPTCSNGSCGATPDRSAPRSAAGRGGRRRGNTATAAETERRGDPRHGWELGGRRRARRARPEPRRTPPGTA